MYMKPSSGLIILLFCTFWAKAQLTTQEKLGYAKDTRLLIIHADDLGVAHSENQAAIRSMEKGSTSSASIMVPCPWFAEIAAYAVAHPKADFGLHLTLTSEWKYYKWGPLTDETEAPGLVNKEGFLYESVDSLYRSVRPGSIEKELRKQIEKARQFGIDVTHFDSHMGALFNDATYLQLLIRLGREYKVPVFLARTGPSAAFNINLDSFLTEKDIMVDQVYTASPGDYKKGMAAYYTSALQSMQPGLNIIIMHTAYDDTEMQAITIDHPDWGAAWRQADFNFFTSDQCRKLLAEHNIRVITWREVRDKLYR